jgi:hypothetical protein
MSGTTTPAEKQFFALFRKILRDLSPDAEKSRRKAIRDGKRKEVVDLTVPSNLATARKGKSSMTTRAPGPPKGGVKGAQQPPKGGRRETSVKAQVGVTPKGAKPEKPRKSAATERKVVAQENAKARRKTKRALERAGTVAEKQTVSEVLALEKREQIRKRAPRRGRWTGLGEGEYSILMGQGQAGVADSAFGDLYEAWPLLYLDGADQLVKVEKCRQGFKWPVKPSVSWSVDRMGKPIRVKRDYQKAAKGAGHSSEKNRYAYCHEVAPKVDHKRVAAKAKAEWEKKVHGKHTSPSKKRRQESRKASRVKSSVPKGVDTASPGVQLTGSVSSTLEEVKRVVRAMGYSDATGRLFDPQLRKKLAGTILEGLNVD